LSLSVTPIGTPERCVILERRRSGKQEIWTTGEKERKIFQKADRVAEPTRWHRIRRCFAAMSEMARLPKFAEKEEYARQDSNL
jgi:hypothetical protein